MGKVGLGVLVLVLSAGCGDSKQSDQPDLTMVTLPDGFLQTSCTAASDCDDNDPCTTDTCLANTRVCGHAPVSCSNVANDCNDGVCNRTTGACEAEAINENKACVDGNGNDGTCKIGTCVKNPTCVINQYLDCFSTTSVSGNTTFSVNALENYTCGTGFVGNEQAYAFYPTSSGPTTVTLSGTNADLDLLIVEGSSCSSTAACAGKAITVGTGNETVTFPADRTKTYTFIVDSKSATASSAFTLAVGCPPVVKICETAGKTLACNQTIIGDTSASPYNQASITQCTGAAGITAGDVGPEDSWKLNVSDSTDFKIKLTGMTQDLDLSALYSNNNTDCDGFCKSTVGTTTPGFSTGLGDETITFSAFSGSTYFVLVDSRNATGGPYQMEVSCPPNCASKTSYISCSTPAVSGLSDDATRTTNIIDSWGTCATGTTGPETVYAFYASTAGSYTFDLTWSDPAADLDLIIVEGTSSGSCDPTGACFAHPSVAVGTKRTITATLTGSTYYYIAVDTKNSVSTPYSLRLSSPKCTTTPTCRGNTTSRLSCSYPSESRRNDDPARSLNAVDSWGVAGSECDTNTTGSEVVYQFTPADSGMYTVNLTNLDAGKNLDLVVLESTNSFTCDPTKACLTSSVQTGNTSEQVTFNALSSKYYFIAVDGVNGDFSKYSIALSGTKTSDGSNACAGPACTDGFRNLDCGSLSTRVLTNSNDATGATSTVSTWGTTTPCASSETGPEYAHKFVPTKTGSYTFELFGTNANLDLIIVEANAGSCNAKATTCLGAGISISTTTESVTVSLTKNKIYYIVVDGKDGATSNYTLAVTSGC